MEKARQLWTTLSENEPENQARPATLEQLIVMLTRESARRVVHFVNFTRTAVTQLPNTISKGVHVTTSQCLQLVENIIKVYGDNLLYTDNYYNDRFVYDDSFTDRLDQSVDSNAVTTAVLGNAFKIHLILMGYFTNSCNNN